MGVLGALIITRDVQIVIVFMAVRGRSRDLHPVRQDAGNGAGSYREASYSWPPIRLENRAWATRRTRFSVVGLDYDHTTKGPMARQGLWLQPRSITISPSARTRRLLVHPRRLERSSTWRRNTPPRKPTGQSIKCRSWTCGPSRPTSWSRRSGGSIATSMSTTSISSVMRALAGPPRWP